ncbi:MAG: RNA repair transcriptional activator RtcR [Mailhella sp.]|nr:RNA repair transcriptional activator RtcR [Mailhella sp.]
MEKKLVVIGMLGTTLDAGKMPDRWERWRPTVAACMHPDLPVSRIDILRRDDYGPMNRRVMNDIRTISPQTETVEHVFSLKDPWDFEEVYAMLFDFAKSYPFDTEHEDYLIHMTTGTHVMQICLFLLVESRHIPARLLQTQPLPKEQMKPQGTWSVIDLDLSRYDQIAARFKAEGQAGVHFLKAGIDTRNAGFNALIERIARVSAASSEPILLTGPSGSGKTRLARLIYEWRKQKRRVQGSFVELNCATLRGAAAMSALFGHAKGAYTGASEARSGLMKAADGGMLFLDEVGELGPDEQAMLLRALEEKRFYPMGSDKEVFSDFQLICGTNRSLHELAAQGKFRYDLLARIDLWSFELPGLADRPEDIEPNLDYELERVRAQSGDLVSFSREARELFLHLAYGKDALWKGNFRDLSGAVTRMAALSEGGRITEEGVFEEWGRLRRSWGPWESGSPAREKRETKRDFCDSGVSGADMALVRELLGERAESLDAFDVPQLACVLRACRSSATLSDAGRKLFAASRLAKATGNDADRLRKYLARFGLDWRSVAKRE